MIGKRADCEQAGKRIYDKVLTENEVRALYLNPAGTGTTKIAGDQITTGKIQSNNLSTTEGSEFNLDDGTFKLGGTTNSDLSLFTPIFFNIDPHHFNGMWIECTLNAFEPLGTFFCLNCCF